MSSEREIILDALIPGAGCSSYIVTTGPGDTLIISPSILKSDNTNFKASALRFNSSFDTENSVLLSGLDKISTNGGLYFSISFNSISFCIMTSLLFDIFFS